MRWSRVALFALLIQLISFSQCSFAAFAPAVSVVPNDREVSLSGRISFLREESADWNAQTVAGISADKWEVAENEMVSFGFTTDAYWFRVEFKTPHPSKVDGLLIIGYPSLDSAKIFRSIPGQPLSNTPEYAVGDREPFANRFANNRNFLIPITFDSSDSQVIYIRAQTDGSLQVPLSYIDRQHYFDSEQKTVAIQGIYFGILLIMGFYNFFIFLTVRDSAYATYSIFVLFILLFQGSLHGFGFQFLWPDSPDTNRFIIPFSVGGCVLGGTLFAYQFLGLRLVSKNLANIMLTLCVIGFFTMLTSFVLPYSFTIRLGVISNFVSIIFGLFCGLYGFKKGLPHARYFILAWGFLLIAVAVLDLNKSGILPLNFFTEYSMQIGSAMEAMLLSFALGDRINTERKLKQDAEHQAFEKERMASLEQERFLREEMLSQQKLVAAEAESRAKSQFLATMSHEIRTPMNGVLGMAELLQETSLQPQQRTYVEVILQSGKVLLNVINDILDFSKIQAGKMEIESIDFDLEQLCLECASVFSLAAEKKNIELIAYSDIDIPTLIKSDPNRIRQVALNLMSNAFKFTSEGKVIFHVHKILNDGKEFLRFEVTDSGIGISPEQQQKLFAAFSQADTSTSRKYGGTGLGLAISKKLIEMMGGQIGLHSEIGQGSTFWFTLPLVHSDRAPQEDHANSLKVLAGKRLLVVDDCPDFAHVIQNQAKRWGIQVELAYNGTDALKVLETAHIENKSFDLVTLDMKMPDLTGLEVAQRMQSNEQFRKIPRILLTAMRNPPQKQVLMEAGIIFYQQKPVSSRGFRDLLVDAFSNQQLLLHDSQKASAESFTGKKVLVAEDNSVNQMVVSGLLKKLGVTATIVSDGQQAFDAYKSGHSEFDLILMDCEMPETDGFAATRLIRTWEAESNLPRKPIVALTAHAMQEYQQRCKEVGMDAHVSKPIQLSLLRDVFALYLKP